MLGVGCVFPGHSLMDDTMADQVWCLQWPQSKMIISPFQGNSILQVPTLPSTSVLRFPNSGTVMIGVECMYSKYYNPAKYDIDLPL